VTVSVITPSLNNGARLRAAIESVRRQQGVAFEHIVVDGGSTDGTAAVLDACPDVTAHRTRGIERADAVVIGRRLARGEIIVCLNADERFTDDAFASVMPAFKQGAQAVMGNVRVHAGDNDGGGGADAGARVWINSAPGDFAHLMRHWEPNAFCLSPAALFVRRQALDTWLPDLLDNQGSNLDLQLHLAGHGGIEKIETVLAELVYPPDCKQRLHQAQPSFWRESRFPFLRKHLLELQGEDRADYLRRQRHGYQMRRHQAIEAAKLNGTLPTLLASGEALPLDPGRGLFCAPGDTVAAFCATDDAPPLRALLAPKADIPVLTFGPIPLRHDTAFLSDPEDRAHHILDGDPTLALYRKTRASVQWHFLIAWDDRLTEADLQTFKWTCGLLAGDPDLDADLPPGTSFAMLQGVSARVCLYRKEGLPRSARHIVEQFLGIPA
jgi:glycosyltransferase involved in cell wall biosynthesis